MSTPDLFSQLETKPKPRQSKPWWLWPLVGVMGGAFFMLLVYAVIMREDIQKTELDVPLVRAPETPVKTRPDAPGGMDVPNRDKLVFDLLAPEIQEPAATQSQSTATLQAQAQESASPPDNTPEKTASAKPEDDSPATSTQASEDTADEPPVDPLAAVIAAREAEEARVAATQSTSTEAAASPQTTSGAWGVQLASFVNETDAEAALQNFAGRFPDVLGALKPRVQSVTLGQGKGNRYRAQFVGVDKARAQAICQQLKQQNQACLRVQR